MEVFMKNKFRAYETLKEVDFRFEESDNILTLKVTGINRGRRKQIQINFSKMDFTEVKTLKIFLNDAVKFTAIANASKEVEK